MSSFYFDDLLSCNTPPGCLFGNDYTHQGELYNDPIQRNRKDSFDYPPMEPPTPYIPEGLGLQPNLGFIFHQVMTVSPKDICSSPPLDSPSSTSSSPDSGISSLPNCNSEGDPEDESDSNDTDEEYTPPVVGTRKRCRSSTSKSYRRSSSAVSTSTSTSTSTTSSSSRPTKRIRSSPPSRNRQANSSMSATIALACSVTSADETDFTCPQCPYKQKNRRMPDFKRHLKTHLRASQDNESHGWWCKGVLLERADEYDIKDLEPYTFLRKQRVGGCRLSFSRRDALKRHLDNVNVGCVGVPSAPDVD